MRISLKKNLLALAMATALFVPGVAQEKVTPALSVPEPTVVRVDRLQLTAPGGWYQLDVPSDEPNAATVLASNDPTESQAVMIISVVPKRGRTMAAFNSMTRNYVITKMDGLIEYERDRTVSGAPAHVFVYEGRSEHSSKGRRKFLRTVIDKGANFYVLQSTTDHVAFPDHAGAIEAMVNSVSWTP